MRGKDTKRPEETRGRFSDPFFSIFFFVHSCVPAVASQRSWSALAQRTNQETSTLTKPSCVPLVASGKAERPYMGRM